jgi:D-psicose/D-tagatose/L-ribulose 3-epimerase
MISRRVFLAALTSFARLAPARLAICSETFAPLDFAAACRLARRIGYAGIEIQPSHLDPDPVALPAARRREIRRLLAAEGLACPAFHSLLGSPPGLHLTTADEAVRRRSWDYLAGLVELAAEISPGSLLVLGSGKQRQAVGGVSVGQATAWLSEGLAWLAPRAERAGVTVLIEPLAPHLCNVVNTLEEALRIARAIGSPALATILDTHNTAAEKEPVGVLVERYGPWIRHVHLNEYDGSAPGRGNYPFAELLRAFERRRYQGWLSVELFDFKPDGETVAREAFEYLSRLAG